MTHERSGYETDRTVTRLESLDFLYGSLDYLHINPYANHPGNNPMIVVPGFTQGIEVMGGFGEALGQDGQREVFVLDQIKRLKKGLERPKPFSGDERLGVAQQAEALLSLIEQNGLQNNPLDFAANSMGALVLVKAASYGWDCFNADKGSHSFFIGPAGLNPEENIFTLGARFGRWTLRNIANNKILDPDLAMMRAGMQNAFEDKTRTINEVRALAKTKIDLDELGQKGVKPFVFTYADDHLMPYRSWGPNAENNLESLNGVASIVDTNGVGASSWQDFKAKTGLSGKQAKDEWAHHYRRADHNDMQFHPHRTANAILQILSRQKP